ncbi:sugar dehydrogenase complex small subunit [Fluviispira multicolorata]|uniref:Uncharacterized protein n=1 Tax=Fluviispira multicolorata TaxID=2654512 RepID=A0A833JF56_9BACT|nr:sugar dehydrogenase complex small subunit [Fluviispira multicolorata]KAB8033559.1 hypothetical protein GCL57_02300 [Fluviispira multicolorata]
MSSKITKKELSRRKFILIGGVAAAGALFLDLIAWSDQNITLTQPNNFAQKKASLTESEFLLLSKFLMNDDALDADISKKLYTFIRKSNADIYSLYEYIRTHKSLNKGSFKSYLQSNKKALKVYTYIAKAWYSGVLTIGKVSMRFTYFDSYMFRLMAGLAPTPGICGGATNYWSEKPNVG